MAPESPSCTSLTRMKSRYLTKFSLILFLCSVSEGCCTSVTAAALRTSQKKSSSEQISLVTFHLVNCFAVVCISAM